LPLSARAPYVLDVTETPPVVPASPRRKRSRQRDRILAWLRATDIHPNAAEIHAALQPEIPALSLGTVYRNLEVLAAEGEIEEVPSAAGSARYDANLEPHHHFNCDGCGRILDVDLPVPRGLARRLAGEHGLRSRRVRISFFGLCPACESSSQAASEARRSLN
jgi:Fe2+ or Zn2+ uptake regulation protein